MTHIADTRPSGHINFLEDLPLAGKDVQPENFDRRSCALKDEEGIRVRTPLNPFSRLQSGDRARCSAIHRIELRLLRRHTVRRNELSICGHLAIASPFRRDGARLSPIDVLNETLNRMSSQI